MLRGNMLPFELCGQSVAGPAGEGVGLKEAEVADGSLGDFAEGLPAVEGEDRPIRLVDGIATPVERGLPVVGL